MVISLPKLLQIYLGKIMVNFRELLWWQFLYHFLATQNVLEMI